MNAGYGNNSLKTPTYALKLSIVAFLCVQAIRQLIQVNNQAREGAKDKAVGNIETSAGQVSTWMTIILTLFSAGILFPSAPLSKEWIMGGFATLIVGVLASGSAMIYDIVNNKAKAEGVEKNRMWFGIAHIIFAVLLLAYALFTFV
jgi:hypothetical protein